MRRLAIVLLLLTPLAPAQILLPPGELARLRPDFEPRAREQPLRCDLNPLGPGINFAFRFEAGYMFRVPQSQYSGSSAAWSILTAITPEHGDPTYLLQRKELSNASKVDSNFEIFGVYFLGVGRYSVESSIRDDRNRVCRKQWRIVVAPSHANRLVPSMLPPGAVRPFSQVVLADAQHQDSAEPMRLSILLNAAAFSTRRTVIRPFDRTVLLGALTSLMEHLPSTSLRVVVFSLEQQREVYRTENFSPSDVVKVAGAIRALDQATVDVHVLQKPQGHVGFLASLISHEFGSVNPVDTVVFLGPTSRYGPFIPRALLPTLGEGSPRLFYVRYGVPRRPSGPIDFPGNLTAEHSGGGGGGRRGGGGNDRGPSLQPAEGQSDIITAAVGRLKGKTLIIHTPAELAKAIRKIEGKR